MAGTFVLIERASLPMGTDSIAELKRLVGPHVYPPGESGLRQFSDRRVSPQHCG
eukprot:SAG25_NODE_136_length_14215_cov_15.693114_7_plen_54_part_00